MVQITKLAIAIAALVAAPVLALPAAETSANESTLEKRSQVLHCYNSGATSNRAPIINAITSFCNGLQGAVVQGNTVGYVKRYDFPYPNLVHIDIKAETVNGCTYTIGQQCYDLLRVPTDSCNTSGENGKQGGYVTVDNCSKWTMDPNY